VAALCGVEHLLGRRPETLSGGERQRVGLARALAPRPRLLLCDEPVSAIDLDRRFDLLDRLRAVQREESIPILYVTHSPAEALEIAGRVFLMDAGAIQDEGPPLEMLTSTKGDALAHHKGFRNRFVGHVIEDADSERVTRVKLQDGPVLVVPRHDAGPNARVCVTIRAEDILLANGPVAGLSAQNLIPGVIDRVALHGPDAEVLVRVDGTRWIVSVVQRAVEQLDLKAGRTVYLILKSRSCELELLGSPGPS
jgi:molybdate transport system ATP-binding protein